MAWSQIVLGGFLVAFMAVITFVVSKIISQPGELGSGTRFTGTASDVMFIYAIFAVVIAIGLACIAGGIMTIRYGKTNKIILVLILALALTFYILGVAFQHTAH